MHFDFWILFVYSWFNDDTSLYVYNRSACDFKTRIRYAYKPTFSCIDYCSISVSVRLFLSVCLCVCLSLSLSLSNSHTHTHKPLLSPEEDCLQVAVLFDSDRATTRVCLWSKRGGDENCDLLADRPLFTRPYRLRRWRGSNEVSLCVRPRAVPAGRKGFIRSYVLACARTASTVVVATTTIRTAWGSCPPPRLIPRNWPLYKRTRPPPVAYLFHDALHNRN